MSKRVCSQAQHSDRRAAFCAARCVCADICIHAAAISIPVCGYFAGMCFVSMSLC